MRRTLLIVMLPALLAGCRARQETPTLPAARGPNIPLLFGNRADPETAASLATLPYPAQAPLGEDLDIVVAQDGATVCLANRTPRPYSNMQLWLNQQYVGLIDQITIGDDAASNCYKLRHFINHYSEPFPVGGLLNPDRSFPIVLAELFDPATGQRHRLLVWTKLK